MQPNQRPPYLAILIALFAGAVAGSAITTGIDALADGNPATDTVPRMISYQGQLELDGVAVNASGVNAVPVRFELYDRREGGAPVYTQQLRLNVFEGRFATSLGPFGDNNTSIADVVSGADELFLGMTLTGNPNIVEDDISLAGRQQLQVSPHALWSRYATNFDVASNLQVNGNLQAGGNLQVGGTQRIGRHSHLGTGRPASGVPQLKLDNNVAENGVMNNFNDYQLLLFQSGTPAQSYGLGIQSNTLFINTAQDIKFYRNGTSLMELKGNGSSTLSGNLAVSGNISGNFQMSVSEETLVDRNRNPGTTPVDLGVANGRRFCFLTRAGNEETDSGGEWAQCRVVVASNGQWQIRAELNPNASDTRVFCGARCVSW
ncbi:MAG: hypothetical protein AAFX99_20375 [Myxococcota bacterium]